MRKYFDFVEGTDGRAIRGASVTVRSYPADVLVTLYSDAAGLVPIQNPITTDAAGFYEFYVAEGHYTLYVSGPGLSTRTITDVVIFDGDAIVDASTNAAAAAASAASAATSATSATASQGVATTKASEAAASAAAAAASATAASGSASSASTSATSASTSASSATSSASAAAASATAADASADAAALSEAQAAAIVLGNFLQSGTGAVARTFTSKNRDIVSVKDFGAVGDGVTDDTAAINAAITYIDSVGGGTVSFERGKTYLISPLAAGIVCCSNLVLDLNGAALRKATNGLATYQIVSASNIENVVIRNGAIKGDRYTHDYSSGGTHEFGMGVSAINVRNLRIEKMRISECTGDSIVTGAQRISYYRAATVSGGGIVAGGINSSGVVDTALAGYYTPTKMSIADVTGTWFHLWFRDFGRDFNKMNAKVKVFYYDGAGAFISAKVFSMWAMEEKVANIPAGATQIAFHMQDWLWPLPAAAHADLGAGAFGCCNVTISDCELFDSRRQGYSVTGARNVSMVRTHIHDISGTSPQSAVDIEDLTNTQIYFGQCVFENNVRNFLNISGLDVTIDGCKMDGGSRADVTLCTATSQISVSNTTISKGTITASGKTRIDQSTFEDCSFAGAPQSDGTSWAASTAYSLAAQRVPTASTGFYYEVTTAGTSSATEPNWPGVIGQTVVDGTVTWTCKGYSQIIPAQLVVSNCAFLRCSSNYSFTSNAQYVMRFSNCRMDYGIVGGNYSLFQNVEFNVYSSITAYSFSTYDGCVFRAYPAANLTFGQYSTLKDCEIYRKGSTGGNYITFNQYCQVFGGLIQDNCSVASPLELKNNVRFTGTRFLIQRNISFNNEGIYVNGASCTLDGVTLDHTGTISAANSALVGLASGSSGFAARGCTFSTDSTSGSTLVYTRSGTPTYDIFKSLLVKCVEPASSPGVNRLAGNTVV